MRRVIVALAASVALTLAGAAVAGEVKGPPGTLNNTNKTGAPANANSNCAYSGLNDYDLSDPGGQLVNQTQTAADSWKIYGLPKGVEGKGAPEFGIDSGLCRGGTNESRTK